MSTPLPQSAPVVHLDLRTDELAGTDPADLRAAVSVRLARQGRPQPHDQRFLVVDTPAGLAEHRTRYEQIMGYRTPGRVHVLCLLVGGLPARAADGYPAERRLVRPATLRGPEAGLLWAGDLQAGDGLQEPAAPDDPQSLAVLVDLLSVPEVYDETLDVLGGLPDGVAAPGLRVLEHGLSPDVRSQAWSEALLRFAGSHTASPAGPTARAGGDLPPALSSLVTGATTGSPGRREEGGAAARAHHAAVDGLADAETELVTFGSPVGLLTGAGRAELESALGRARQALDRYREVVGQVLRSDGGTAGVQSAAESSTRLARLGMAVAPAGTSGERIGDSLRSLALGLLREGLPLRSVAQRFALLAEQVQPLSNAPLLADLDRLRAPEPRDRELDADPPGNGVLAVAGLVGAVGGLWAVPGTAAALVVPVLTVLGMLLVGFRLPGGPARPADALRLGAAALAGAAVAAVTAQLAGVPLWAAVAGLLLALGCWAFLLLRAWHLHAQRWGRERGVTPLQDELNGLDDLLARALRECWAVEERRYCADAALSVVGVLRATAEAAEAEATRDLATETPAAEEGADDWLNGSAEESADDASWQDEYDWTSVPPRPDPRLDVDLDEPTGVGEAGPGPAGDTSTAAAPGPVPGAPRWLERGEAKGGPDLVPTLAADLTDATLTALEPYWGAVERGYAGDAAQERIAERVRELLGVARDHLRRNDVLPAPPFTAPHRVRSGPAGLLGIDARRVTDSAAVDPDGQGVVQLSSAEQLDLLSRNPAAVALIRFAPEAARDGSAADAAADPVAAPPAGRQESREVRTAAGRYAGTLRLTALRAGVVETVRPRHGAPSDTEEEQW
ncbi:hypothetical protein ACWDRR_01975 [Kitasatospora sp. NPDC003701]